MVKIDKHGEAEKWKLIGNKWVDNTGVIITIKGYYISLYLPSLPSLFGTATRVLLEAEGEIIPDLLRRLSAADMAVEWTYMKKKKNNSCFIEKKTVHDHIAESIKNI